MSLSPRRPAKPPQKSGSSRPAPHRSRSKAEPSPSSAAGQRLQKVLAAAGVASRRECEERILQGRVEVDRQVVTEMGFRVNPETQEIRVDGQVLPQPKHVYFLVHKPMGVVSTNRDPARRMRVIDLVPEETRMFTVGRLDQSSEGLILVTNDGELANQLTHPRYGIAKTYRAQVLGFPTPETLQKLRKGVYLAEGVARVAELKASGRHSRGAELELVLTEGRNREIRRVLARVGHKVLRLRRVALGPLKLGTLQAGESRRLTAAEVQALRNCVRDQKTQSTRKAAVAETESVGLPVRDAGTKAERPRRASAMGPQGASGAKRPATRTVSRGVGRGPERPGRPRRQDHERQDHERQGLERQGLEGKVRERQGGQRVPKPGAVLDYDASVAPTSETPRPPRQKKTRPEKVARRKPHGKGKRPG